MSILNYMAKQKTKLLNQTPLNKEIVDCSHGHCHARLFKENRGEPEK